MIPSTMLDGGIEIGCTKLNNMKKVNMKKVNIGGEKFGAREKFGVKKISLKT
jgi:hypothetical protein